MDLVGLRAFLAIADELHFGRAARRVHLTQSALSKQIRRLEDDLGARFFDRSRRHVELTAAGRRLLPHARAIAARIERAREDIERAGGGPARLVIGFVSSTPDTLLAKSVARFQAAEPEVEVTLKRMTGGAQLEALAEGLLDVGFVRTPFDVPPGIVIEKVLDDPLRVALRKADPLARRRAISRAELTGRRVALFPRASNPLLYDAIVRALGRPRLVTEVPDLLRALPFVAEGVAITLVARSVRAPRGVVLRELRPEIASAIGVMSRERPTPLTARFLGAQR